MLGYTFDFEHPWYLLLLAGLPLLWWFSFHTLAALGPVQRWFALALRTVVIVLLVLALAELQVVQTSERVTVLYLLDQSLSIPEEHRERMVEYVNRSIMRHRRDQDRAGVIVFARDADIEIPPFDDDVQLGDRFETLLHPDFDPQHTNFAAAIKLAQATFPEDASKRIVVVSDGNQNLGDALEEARIVTEAGIGIDVLPITYRARAEVIVEKVSLPADVRKGQPFDLRVVVTNTAEPTTDDPGNVKGTLRISDSTGGDPVVLSEQEVTLQPGTQTFSIRQTIDDPNFYEYEARFIPAEASDDVMAQNNRATTFTHVRGSGQVLLIADHESTVVDEHERFVEALATANLEVTVQPSDDLFTDLAALQRFDTVVLGNVPRERFTERQIDMLVRNTEQMGSGLVMLGGPNSFGAGGWSNTALEDAMPVDFQIKNLKVVPRGALALIMHASEMARGNHWQKVIAREAIKGLGPDDFCGLLHWNGRVAWLWGGQQGMIPVGPNRQMMLGLLDRMAPGDMPEFEPAMKVALGGFVNLPARTVKHMVIISDGDPSPPGNRIVTALKDADVTVSTVMVAGHGGGVERRVMQDIASVTGGKFYYVNNPGALPRIIQREARRVARPLVYENPNGFSPHVDSFHEILSGIPDRDLPPITGYVLSTRKQNPLVEVTATSPRPAGSRLNTVLASWTYGLGKAVAFTTDTGARWAKNWPSWENYDKFFSQMIRWSMRPIGDQGKFTVATDFKDGRVRVIVTALDEEDNFLNFLPMSGTVVGPAMDPAEFKLEQTAPGRYMGSFQAGDAGSYFINLLPGAGMAPIRTGVNVPYSDEFRQQEADPSFLVTLAELKPDGGESGRVYQVDAATEDLDKLFEFNPFRRDLAEATSRQDVWHYLVLAACGIFFFDVFVRRVSIGFAWLLRALAKARDELLGRETEVEEAPTMERLRSRKAELADQIEQRRAAARFEPTPDAQADDRTFRDEVIASQAGGGETAAAGAEQPAAEQQQQESYTSRLLKAKKQVWKDREKEES